MKIVETIATGLRSLGVTVLNGVFVAPLLKTKDGLNSVEIKSNQVLFYANKGDENELKFIINLYDDGSALEMTPTKDGVAGLSLYWSPSKQWRIGGKQILVENSISYDLSDYLANGAIADTGMHTELSVDSSNRVYIRGYLAVDDLSVPVLVLPEELRPSKPIYWFAIGNTATFMKMLTNTNGEVKIVSILSDTTPDHVYLHTHPPYIKG